MRGLSQETLNQHLRFIRTAFEARFVIVDQGKKERPEILSEGVVDQAELKAKAVAIGEKLLGEMMFFDDFATLLQTNWLDESCFELKEVENSLYEGVTGMALFLSALHYETRQERYKRAASLLLQPLTSMIGKPVFDQHANIEGIGGANGLGSYLYTFTKIAHFLK